jgi:hypothetical protein
MATKSYTDERYEIIDGQTGYRTGGTYQSLARAHRRADVLDLRYGAIRYGVRRVKQERTIDSDIAEDR